MTATSPATTAVIAYIHGLYLRREKAWARQVYAELLGREPYRTEPHPGWAYIGERRKRAIRQEVARRMGEG